MNFGQLYSKLLNILAENATPQYWLEAELKGYINDGLVEFVKRSRFLRKNAYLDKSDLEDGVYFLPTDIIEPVGVQYLGKPLDKKSLKFLETAYSGTSHQRELVGAGYRFEESWRDMTGDPVHWFFENQMVKVFPKPAFVIGNSSASLIKTISATLYQTNNEIQLPIPLPYGNQNLIDLYINGVYQNVGDWSIDPADSSRLLLPYTSTFTAPVEVVYQNSAIVATKYGQSVTTGQDEFTFLDCFYNNVTDSVKVLLNGVMLNGADYLISVPGTNDMKVTLVTPAASDGTIEVIIYTPLTISGTGAFTPNRIADQVVTMDYIYLPAQLSDSADEPEIPAVYHDACWQWAAFLALSKEGSKSEDVKKSTIYLDAFERAVNASRSFTDSEVDIEPATQMPWRM